MTMNLPFEGQRYRLKGIRYEPDPDGAAALVKVNADRTAVMYYRGKACRAWLSPEGFPCSTPLEPFKTGGYRKTIDGHFVHDPLGVYRISGVYPNFVTNTGETVFMDFDRSFWTRPVDLWERGRRHVSNLVASSKLRRGKPGRVKRELIVGDNEYRWKLTQGDRVLIEGTAETRSRAERDMIAAQRLERWRNVR